jgi:flagellar hook protein FlgE
VVFARYTNGQALTLGQVALATFANPQGLSPVGNTAWAESFDSGQPVIGSPQSGSRGAIQAGGLEDSNVDLSAELVNLILAQRDYQANAKTIETNNAVTQTIINLR